MTEHNKIRSEIDNIEQAIERNDETSVSVIDESIHRLFLEKDDQAIKSLLLLLDENFHFQEGMWSIMHYAESFPADAYVDAVLSSLVTLNDKSTEWANRLIARMLNSDVYKNILMSRLMIADVDAKDAFAQTCHRINTEHPGRFEELIAKINYNLLN